MNKHLEPYLSEKESVCLVVTDVPNVLSQVFVLDAKLVNSLTLWTLVCVSRIVVIFQMIMVLLTISFSIIQLVMLANKYRVIVP